jgi:hypothetical protein
LNYRLTQKGMDLAPVLLELLLWGARHERTGTPRAVISGLQKHRAELLSEVRQRWRKRDPTPLQVRGEWVWP